MFIVHIYASKKIRSLRKTTPVDSKLATACYVVQSQSILSVFVRHTGIRVLSTDCKCQKINSILITQIISVSINI